MLLSYVYIRSYDLKYGYQCHHIVQFNYVVGENIGEFSKLIAIHQYFTHQYFLTNLYILNPNLPNISLPVLGDSLFTNIFPHRIITLYGIKHPCLRL